MIISGSGSASGELTLWSDSGRSGGVEDILAGDGAALAGMDTGFFGDFERDALPGEVVRIANVDVEGLDLSAACVSIVETRSALDMEPRKDGLARADPNGTGVVVEKDPEPKEASDQFRCAVEPEGRV